MRDGEVLYCKSEKIAFCRVNGEEVGSERKVTILSHRNAYR